MRVGECTAYLEFLTDGERLLGAHDFQSAYSSALSAFQWYEVDDVAKVILDFLGYQSRQFLLGIFHSPAIEIRCFLVVVVEHLREHLFVGGVAIGLWRCTDPIVKECLIPHS